MIGWVPQQPVGRTQPAPARRASLPHQPVSEEPSAVLILPRGRPRQRPRQEASLTIFPRQTQPQACPHRLERQSRSRHHEAPMYRESPLATAQQPVLTPAQEWRQRYAYSRYSGSAAARTLVSPPPRMDVGHDTILDVAIPVDVDVDTETTAKLLRRAGFLRPAYLHLLSALLLFAGLDCLLLASGVLPNYAAVAISLASALALLAWCVARPRAAAPPESTAGLRDTEELDLLATAGDRDDGDPDDVDNDLADPDDGDRYDDAPEDIAVPAAAAAEPDDAGDGEDDAADDDDVRADNIDSDHVPVEDIDLDRIAAVGASTDLERCPRDPARR